jgi:hypothetical protein
VLQTLAVETHAAVLAAAARALGSVRVPLVNGTRARSGKDCDPTVRTDPVGSRISLATVAPDVCRHAAFSHCDGSDHLAMMRRALCFDQLCIARDPVCKL